MDRRNERMARVLLEHWDPLLVADIDLSPEREYVDEAKALLDVLDNDGDLGKIRSFLTSSSRELEPSLSLARVDAVAQAVWDFYWSDDEWVERLPPLVQAAVRGDLDTIAELIAAAVSPDQATTDGFSALHAAASRGLDDVGMVLLNAGASVEARDSDGWTPLLLAAGQRDNAAMVRLLLDFGADPNAQDHDEMWRPLTLAAESCQVEAAALLVDAGADGSWVEPAGQSPLASAIRTNCPEMVELLLAAGADPAVNSVVAALDHAQESGFDACLAAFDRYSDRNRHSP